MPLIQVTMQRAKEHELRTSLRQMREAIDAYKQAVDEGRIAKRVNETGYPKSLETLVAGVEDAQNPKKTKIYFLRRIPRDPMAPDATVAAAETWGKRGGRHRAQRSSLPRVVTGRHGVDTIRWRRAEKIPRTLITLMNRHISLPG